MTNPKDKSSSEKKAQTDASLDQLASLGQAPNFETLFEAHERVLANLAAISSVMFDFYRARMRHAAAISGAMTDIGNVGGAMELQAEYSRTMIEDSVRVAGKIAALSMGGLAEGVTAMQGAASEQRPPMAQAAE